MKIVRNPETKDPSAYMLMDGDTVMVKVSGPMSLLTLAAMIKYHAEKGLIGIAIANLELD